MPPKLWCQASYIHIPVSASRISLTVYIEWLSSQFRTTANANLTVFGYPPTAQTSWSVMLTRPSCPTRT